MNTLEFQTEVMSHAKPTIPSKNGEIVADYIAARRKARQSMTELGLGEHGRREAEMKLLETYFRRWLSAKYGTLDMSFTKETRRAVVRRTSKGKAVKAFDVPATYEPESSIVECVIQLPVYVVASASTKIGPIDFTTKELGSFRHGRYAKEQFSTDNIFAACTCPDGFNRGHVREYQRFQARVIEGFAALVRKGINPTTILDNDRWQRERFRIPETSLSVLWAPLDEHWQIRSAPPPPKGDPAVIAEFLGVHYLLAMFDTPDEKPIEGVIREFSTGRLTPNA